MIRQIPSFFMDEFVKTVYKINLNFVMVQELKYYLKDNVYIKLKTNNGLYNNPR